MYSQGSISAHPVAISPPSTVEVLGVPLALTDYEGMLDWIDAMVEVGERGYVCVCNVHTVMASAEDPELRSALLASSVNVPDGQPLVWAINALGHSLAGRVYGPELMSRACARAASSGRRFYLYGGRNQGALVQLALNLRQRYPGVKIVGGYSPPHRPLTDEERRQSSRRSTTRAPTWSGSGSACPSRRSGWRGMRSELEVPVLVGVGAAFDFHAGLVPPGAEPDPGGRSRVGLPARARAATALASLPALQPPLPGGLRPAADRHHRAGAQADGPAARSRPRVEEPLQTAHQLTCPTASIVIPTRGRPGYLDVTLGLDRPAGGAAGAEVLVVSDGADPAPRGCRPPRRAARSRRRTAGAPTPPATPASPLPQAT